jgi:hypothetical protein
MTFERKRGYSYDLECAKLAAYFFGDEPVSQADIDELSQEFQDAAEQACLALERRKARDALAAKPATPSPQNPPKDKS